MARVLLLTNTLGASAEVLPSLALLQHQVKIVPAEASVLIDVPEADILLLDEGFAVGDKNFRDKVNKKILNLKNKNKTLIMVSHWFQEIERNCSSIIWLENGRIVKAGDLRILEEYKSKFYAEKNTSKNK